MYPDRLHPMPAEAISVTPPSLFTYPFCYEAHPLCRMAAEEVKHEILLHREWTEEVEKGKMLGVLVVDGGYLAAFSGTLCRQSTLPYFVPPVFDLHGTYFEEEEARISTMPMGDERKQRSQILQQWLFQQFHFLNAHGKTASLSDIFGEKAPPSGAGECCAPKLLQYAYLHGLRPRCMGEFWMGKTPRGEIREAGNFYPSCQAKCKPILGWMLQGLNVEENPMRKDYDCIIAQLQTIYEDADLIVIDKPAGLLSVPGKDDLPALQDLLPGHPLTVHRLDMDTSGLMVLARNKEVHKRLQEQFIKHIVRKRYSALLEKAMPVGLKGRIDLPLCPNPYDRPRQMIHEEYGRRAITNYEVANEYNGHALVRLWPETGRTHQLRVHMAHPDGLHNPIVGDRLYGHPDKRLMLWADNLSFIHPTTGESMHFEIPVHPL